MGEIRFDGQVVLVTGAGRGLGRAYALGFARRGATVVVHDAGVSRDGTGRDPSVADSVVREIVSVGGVAIAMYQDISRADACRELVREVSGRLGRIDVLVNNAGIVRRDTTTGMPPETFSSIFAINAESSLWMMQAVIPIMERQDYGRIVFTTSGHGLSPSNRPNDLVAYGMSKAAVFGLMNQLAGSFDSTDIQVNCISPVAATRVFSREVGEREFTPEQVAPGVLYLASKEMDESGIVLTSADGRFSIRRLVRTPGVEFGSEPTSPEAIRDRWGEIVAE